MGTVEEIKNKSLDFALDELMDEYKDNPNALKKLLELKYIERKERLEKKNKSKKEKNMDILKNYKPKDSLADDTARDLIACVGGKVTKSNKKKVCLMTELITKEDN